jgi:ABC-type phosphate transport system substrate-binding protein
VFLSVLAVSSVLAGAVPLLSAEAPFRVIVHPQVKGSEITRASLGALFLKQAPRWADGSAVLPVDQSVRSPVRRTFTLTVLRQGLVEVQVYWQRRMSAGVIPPPVKASDEEVLSFVASTPGAIGYVSATTPLPEGVRAVQLAD